MILNTGIVTKGFDLGYSYSWSKVYFGIAGNLEYFDASVGLPANSYSDQIGSYADMEQFSIGGKILTGYHHSFSSKIYGFARSGIGFSYQNEVQGMTNDVIAGPAPLTLFMPYEIGFMIKYNEWIKYGLSFNFRKSYDVLEQSADEETRIDENIYNFKINLELF